MAYARTLLVVLGMFALSFQASPQEVGKPAAEKSAQPSQTTDAQRMAARIDQIIAIRWAAEGVKPASPADDAEFFRRISLDLTGRIPRAFEVRDFLADSAADKRQRVVERLLDSPLFVGHFTNTWRTLLIPQANTPEAQQFVPGFEAWLRQRVRDNMPYDQFVREILLASVVVVAPNRRQMTNFDEPTPVAFFLANELKPENLASSSSRLFLGVKLECAQCHNHPMDNWTRTQFWEFAAFFSGVQPRAADNALAGAKDDTDSRQLTIPGTKDVVQARFLDGGQPKWSAETTTRRALASWMASASNRYFAKAAVNRMWAHLLGQGIVEPVDEMSEQNPPSHPELLDELARDFASHQFDVKYLIKAITFSQAYQRGSIGSRSGADDPRLFTHAVIRGMTTEQLFDSLAQATGFRDAASRGNSQVRAEFLARFSSQEKPADYQASILQALSLMNGKLVEDVTSPERSETLAAVADAPFLNPAQRVEALYLATLSRKPSSEELARFVRYVESGGPKKDSRAALGDVFWALLNCGEFMLNH